MPVLWLPTIAQAARAPAESDGAWRAAERVAVCGVFVALAAALLVVVAGPASHLARSPWLPTLRLDALSVSVLVMVAFLGWVIVRYSRAYLRGDTGRSRYLAWLGATLAAVWCLLVLNNLLLVCLAWSLSSLFLHPLLTFYPTRPAAMLAAHKKFLVSRLADGLTLGACVCLYLVAGTLQIDRVAQIVQEPVAMTSHWTGAAATLFALAAILKCAQLPFHGWLLQVMEAPTPVSALLHAGIVNIGGFILLRLAPVLEASPLAHGLLVVAGSVTAALAALVMMTRISVKVMLAWSTVAQMGFMLLEIGLGAYSLALLHLLAHSMYKAHSFLSAGETVQQQHSLRIAPAVQEPAVFTRVLAAVGLPIGVGLAAWLCGVDLAHRPATWVLAAALVCGLWPLLRARAPGGVTSQFGVMALSAFALSLLYFGWHRLFDHLAPARETLAGPFALGFAAVCLLALLIVQETVLANPDGKLSRWLHPRAFAGFHLDEAFTRFTWRVWPAPPLVSGASAVSTQETDADVSLLSGRTS